MKRFARIFNLLLLSALFAGITGCAPQIVELDLPEYEREIVVEGYLKAGMPPSILLTESVSYFDNPGIPIVLGAEVILEYGNVRDTLTMNPFTLYYESTDTISFRTDVPFHLYVKDSLGRSVEAETWFQNPIPLDSISQTFDDVGTARVIAYFHDPAEEKNYYRITMRSVQHEDDFSVELNDEIWNGEDFAFSTRNRWENGDTIQVRLYTLGKDYYDFLGSARRARIGSDNPLVEPVAVISNIQGGLGIFTTLNFSYLEIPIRP